MRTYLVGHTARYSVGLLIAACLFIAAPSSAQAAGLTTAQVQAVLGLLDAFAVPQATIDNVRNILGGSQNSLGVSITAASSERAYRLGRPIEFSWQVSGVPAHSQVEIELALVKSTSTKSGSSGGTWISPELPLGSSEGEHAWTTGKSRLELSGTYEATMRVVSCDPQGCNYSYANSPRTTYAESEVISIKMK